MTNMKVANSSMTNMSQNYIFPFSQSTKPESISKIPTFGDVISPSSTVIDIRTQSSPRIAPRVYAIHIANVNSKLSFENPTFSRVPAVTAGLM